jgi:hypothetical protein
VGDSNTYYFFTFEAQRLPVTFAPESLRPLTDRLYEVQTMAGVLFKSRINRLVGMRRAPVPGERQQGGVGAAPAGNDYIGGVRTNAETGMVLWPYELVFDCFSEELGKVVETLEHSKEGFLVKSVVVKQEEKSQQPPQRIQPNPGDPRRPNIPPPALTNVINERLLRVTMQVEVIRPEGFGGGGPGPGGGGPGGRPTRGGGRQP